MPDHAPEPEPENDLDPGANTQLFQAFVDRYDTHGSEARRPGAGLIVAAVVALLVVVIVAWILIAH